MPAGDLRYKIGFYQRGTATPGSPPPPDYGYPDAGYPTTATFTTRGNIKPKLGGEAILADRLTGKNFVTIIVRQSHLTAQVDTDWMCKNETSGEQYNIRSVIDPLQDKPDHGSYFEMLCEKGVAV